MSENPNPASSARVALRTRSRGACSSLDSAYPISMQPAYPEEPALKRFAPDSHASCGVRRIYVHYEARTCDREPVRATDSAMKRRTTLPTGALCASSRRATLRLRSLPAVLRAVRPLGGIDALAKRG